MVDSQTVLILGGGVGGVATARALRKRLQRKHRVVLVDRERDHVFAPSLLWLMVGQRTPDSITRPLAGLAGDSCWMSVDRHTLQDTVARWYLGKVWVEQSWLYGKL